MWRRNPDSGTKQHLREPFIVLWERVQAAGGANIRLGSYRGSSCARKHLITCGPPSFSPQQTTKQVRTSKIRPHGIAYALADGGGRMRGFLKSNLAAVSLGILNLRRFSRGTKHTRQEHR